MSKASLLRRLSDLEQRRRPPKELPRPWFGFSIPDSGPGDDDGYVETRTMEEALALGVPVFVFTLPDEDDEGE